MALNHGPAGDIERIQPTSGLPERNGNGHHLRESPPEPVQRRIVWWRGLVLPALVGLTCGGGAYFVSKHYVTPQYSTGTTLLFSAPGGPSMGSLLSGLTGGGGGDMGGSVPLLNGLYSAPQFGSTPGSAMSIMATGRFQTKVVTRLDLPAVWHTSPAQAYGRLNKSVTYAVDRNGFLDIQATDPNPVLAAKLVNTSVQALLETTKQMNTARTGKVRRQLERALQNGNRQLELKNAQLAAVESGNIQRMPLGTGASTTYQALVTDKITTQADLKAATTQLERQIRTARRTYGQGTNLPTSVPFAGDTLVRLRKAESDFRTAQDTLGPDNPDYQKAELALKQARAEVQLEAKRQITAVNTGLTTNISELAIKQATLAGRLDYLNKTIAPIKDAMQSMPAAKIQEDQLTADVRINRALVDQLKVALQQAQLADGSQSLPAFTVVDKAGIPDKPVEPRPLFTMMFAAIAGFLLAAAFQIARTVLRQPTVVDEMRRWSEKYVVMDPYDDTPALEQTRRSLPDEPSRRALAGDTPAALETDETHAAEAEHEHKA